MSAPKYVVSAREKAEGDWNRDSAGTKKDRNPSWCVAFVRFKTPGAMFTGGDDSHMAERPMLVVENDCISVSVSNPKGSFAKTCELTMKCGELYYPNAVAPGDWVFVWMSDQQDDIEKILDLLMKDPRGTISRDKKSADVQGEKRITLNNYYSGLKFIGRVMDVPDADMISANGQRILTQNISCQAFVELASSVYYTFVAQNILTIDKKVSDQASATNFYTNEIAKLGAQATNSRPQSYPTTGVSNGLQGALTNFSKAFDGFYRQVDGKETSDTSPEAVIGLMFILTMGIDAKTSGANRGTDKIKGAVGTFSDAIDVPASVASILGRKGSKLWQMYNLYLGLQSYSDINSSPWRAFAPDFDNPDGKQAVFFRTKYRCKGFVPFLVPPIWDNDSFWNIYSQFLNPIVNEMYTALRVNRYGQILPTLVVREKPFSTNLFDYLMKVAPTFTPDRAKDISTDSKPVGAVRKEISKETDEAVSKFGQDYKKIAKVAPEITKRTLFANLPRWILDESVIKSVSTSANESARINFVQVWGRSRALEITGLNINQEVLKVAQFLVPNYVADSVDIKRHGLRADITETNFDVTSNNLGTISHILARQRADWLFNGHLKKSGSITTMGIKEPICEGDNVQCRGVLYHIESVQHTGSIDASGKKSFTTSLSVSNGMMASSLEGSKIPAYMVGNADLEYTPSLSSVNNLPGFTDVQNTGLRKNRDAGGDSVPNSDKKKGKS